MSAPAVLACSALPEGSVLAPWAAEADFCDAYERRLSYAPESALAAYLDSAALTPAWIERAMRLRNCIVKHLGLKDLGGLRDIDRAKANEHYRVGERLGIFTLLAISPEELLLADADRHLEVRVSVHLRRDGEAAVMSISTAVHVHNWLGRIYMFFVAPVHRRIVPAMLRRLD